MAIKHEFTIISETLIYSIDRRISFINLFLNIELYRLPGAVPSLCVGVGFIGEVGDRYSVSIESPVDRKGQKPQGLVIEEGEIQPEYDREREGGKLSIAVVGKQYINMTFGKTGIWNIVLRQDRKVIHKYPFKVEFKGEAGGAGNVSGVGEEKA